MSRRSSAGELVPRDISEILAREGRGQRGQRKAGGSLGQAFSWLKGSRKKKGLSNGHSRSGGGAGLAEGGGAKLGHPNHDPTKAGPKGQEEQKRLTVHYTASQHYQENVFIEGSRPQYLEDLHTEAQEGLKILQQEEHKHGVDLQHDQSIASAAALQVEEQEVEGSGPKDRQGSPESGSTAGNSVGTVTSAVSSAVSTTTRPVLTRQGSTFKPLNPVKRQDKGKQRSRRTTIMGIPQQVQRELALHRGIVYQQGVSTQIPNGNRQVSEGQSGVVVIPTIDGETTIANQEGARVHLQDLEVSREEKLLQHHLQAVYKDEQAFSHHRLASRLSPMSSKRPKSLAVPGMTSSFSPSGFLFLQDPQGPVMCISPQATYLSKIIPNAILPASVDVIQIDRGNSRHRGNSFNRGGNGRTVSKSSLASGESSASPASSRRSVGDGSHSDGAPDNPPATPSVASGSNWSQSQSSETVISNSSTISSKGSSSVSKPQAVSHTRHGGQPKQPAGDQDMVSLQSSASWVSGTSSPRTGRGSQSGISESASAGEMSNAGRESARESRCFTRSLSIMKTKLPPAPPRRTNSLHYDNVTKRQSRALVDTKDDSDSAFVEVEVGEVEIGESNSLAREETRVASTDTSPPVPVSDSAKSRSLNDSRSSATSGPLTSTGGRGASEPLPVSSSSSPQKAPSDGGKFERTMSPSSGYSSQSGTPTLSPKGIPPISPSPGKQKKKPVKPERSGSRASSYAASVSSSLTSLSSSTSEPVNQEAQANSPSPPQQGSPPPVAVKTQRVSPVNLVSSPGTTAIRELFNVPPPPKVKAPSPPPPETWSHNRHTFELLCGPSPNVNRRPQQQLKATNTVQKTDSQTEVSDNKPQGSAEKEPTEKDVVLSLSENVSSDKTEPLLEKVPESVSQENEGVESTNKEQGSLSGFEKDEAGVEVQRQGESIGPQVKDEGSQERVAVAKKEPPPVMKKSTSTSLRKGPEKLAGGQQQGQVGVVTPDVKVQSPAENEKYVLPEVDAAVDGQREEGKVTTENTEENPTNPQPAAMQTLSVDPPKADKTSPPPSPPPAHQPPPPPSKKTPPSSVSSPPSEENHGAEEEEEEVPMVETCWPPPPPPLEGPADSVFDGPDEIDFPPPPPPFMTESLLPDVVESCSPVMEVQDVSIVALDETGVTLNGESADLSSIVAQTGLEQSRTEVVVHSNPATIISEAPEPAHLQTTSLEEPIATQEATHLSMGMSQLQEVPPLLECVPLPPQEATPLPPITSAEEPNPTSSPLAPSLVVPLSPHLPFEDRPPSSQPPVSAPCPPPVPSPPSLSAENQSAPGVTFRRQPSLVTRETRGKELLSRHKSAPIPKEDANIPLVTPSLLQMVRLRSVTVGDEQQMKAQSEDNTSSNGGSSQDQSPTSTPGAHSVPQKPIRKSLSIKSPSSSLRSPSVTLNAPSMRLQEAIRMKTAAMSSRDGLPTRLCLRSSSSATNSSVGEPSLLSLKSPEGGDLHKSPASTASFIFSRSTKKVVIETPASSSPEAQASLKQSLAAELMQVSDQSKATAVVSNGIGDKANLSRKPSKIPPPVAKKPASGSTGPSENPVCSGGAEKVETGAETNGDTETVQPADQQAPPDQQIDTTETTNMFDTPF